MFRHSSLFFFKLDEDTLHIIPINLEGEKDMYDVRIGDRDSLRLLKDILNEYFDEGDS
jgi:hypothetical protein